MEVIRTAKETQKKCIAWRAAGSRIGLVPTMGFLHEGHLSLVDIAKERADRIVSTIFVNPAQFGPQEDLERYPHDEAGDLAKLEAHGTDLVYCPPPKDVYPPNYQTRVSLERLPQHLCGRSRPVHFGGVATVVSKLFNICQPTVAVFGQKDYQQLLVIRRMAADLNFPVEIVGGATFRETDGLAMSSRNAYLKPAERTAAPALYEALCWARDRVDAGERDARQLHAGIVRRAEKAGGRIDYVCIVDAESLDDVDVITGPAQATLAVHFGAARLIDNLRLTP